MIRLDPDADELKDTIARVARLVLEREREAEVTTQVRETTLPCLVLACRAHRVLLGNCCRSD